MEILFFGSNDDRLGPVKKEIKKFLKSDRKATNDIINRLEQIGRNAEIKQDVDQIVRVQEWLDTVKGYSKRETMYELKSKGQNRLQFRILFTIKRTSIRVVNAFIKKDQKIKEGYIKTAFERAKNFY